MKIIYELPLRNFKPWGVAKVSFLLLTETELDLVEDYLRNMYPHGISETRVNDFFIYGVNTIEEIIGRSLEEEENKEEEEDDGGDYTPAAKIAWFKVYSEVYGDKTFDEFCNHTIYKNGLIDSLWEQKNYRRKFCRLVSTIERDPVHDIEYYKEQATSYVPLS